MKLKPILFSTEMVQAIMAGRKTQTRRTQGLEKLNEDPDDWKFLNVDDSGAFCFCDANYPEEGVAIGIKPNFQPGDILWVRETTCYVQRDHAPDLLEGARKGKASSGRTRAT